MAVARKEASRSGKPMQKTKKKKLGAMGGGKPRMMGADQNLGTLNRKFLCAVCAHYLGYIG